MTLAQALASSTSMITSNSSDIIAYFVAAVGAILILVLAKKGLFWVYRRLVGIIK